MPFPLAAVLAAAPSVISAAADIIRVIREKKIKEEPQGLQPEAHQLYENLDQRLDELADLLERQAKVIEELALNNNNLALAVRNNRVLAAVSVAVGVSAIVLAVLL